MFLPPCSLVNRHPSSWAISLKRGMPPNQAAILLPTEPHRNLLNVPVDVFRTSSRLQLADALAGGPPSPNEAAPSCRPTSRPITYPAPNPTTDTSTTTPALTTHVRSVGLSNDPVSLSASPVGDVRFFLVARGGLLGVVAPRLVRSAVAILISLSRLEVDDGALGALELEAVRWGALAGLLMQNPARRAYR